MPIWCCTTLPKTIYETKLNRDYVSYRCTVEIKTGADKRINKHELKVMIRNMNDGIITWSFEQNHKTNPLGVLICDIYVHFLVCDRFCFTLFLFLSAP